MATKSKNYKAKIAVKAVAFILMVVLLFTGAVNTISPLLRGVSSENSLTEIYETAFSNSMEEKKLKFWRSSLAKNQLQQDGVYLYLYAKYFHNEENVKNGTVQKQIEAEFKEYYDKQAENQIASGMERAKREARNNIASEYGDDNSKYFQMYPESEKVPQEVVDEYLKDHPELLPYEKETREGYQTECDDYIRAMRGNFSKVYTATIERVSKLDSLKYVLVLPDGTRLTNAEDGSTISIDDLQTRIYNSDFGFSYSKDFGQNATKHDWSESVLIPTSKDPAPRGSYSYEKPLYDLQIWQFLRHAPHPEKDELYTYLKQAGIDLYMYSTNEALTISTDNYCELWTEFISNLNNLKTGAILLVLSAVILIVLLFTAGTRDENGKIIKAPGDRVWNDFHLVISAAVIGFALLYLWICTLDSPYNNLLCDVPKIFKDYYIYDLEFWALTTVVITAAAEWLLSVIRHIKAKTLFSHTSVGAIIRKIRNRPKKHRIRNKIKAIRDKFNSSPYKLCEIRKDIWKFLVLYLLGCFASIGLGFLLGYGIIEITLWDWEAFWLIGAPAIFFIVYNVLIIKFLWKSIIALDQIMRAVDEAEQGNLNVNLNINLMPRWIRKFAQDVQDVQNGMRAAVQEAVKGERMKTELITNVSHDLKTPLTSIVTYVDLLKKRPIDDAEAQEYIGVLDEKSARLKHLIEDLVEASKTTTGNVELHPVNLNLNELAVQSVGENEDALTAQGLEIRLNHQPENPIIVYADNQKTWRIIENLISNVRKYALEGTRVYISVEQDGAFGVFSIKNITREALEVSPEELTQRFVRGDASRSTEGSGLGLSIAANLCSLQGGKLDITIDGDLFKVTVYLPLAK